ncbi:hypothetical protein MTO96_013860 [Rhipicephalus appendiculatus]
MGIFKTLLTLAMVATALSLPTLPTPLKPEGLPDRPVQPVVHTSPDASVEPKSPGELKQGERLEGVRSVSNDPSLTTKKQSASDGSAVQATHHVDTHDTSGKDSVVQLKKSVKLNNDEMPSLEKDEAESDTKDTVSHEKPHESPDVELGNDASTTTPSEDKPQEPAKPLQGIIEDVRDFGAPDDAVELPKDVTTLSEDSKTRVPATDDKHKPTDKVGSTHDVPNTEHTPGHPEATNADADVTRKEEYAVTDDGKKPSEASAVTLHDVTTTKSETKEDHPENYHKISKREDAKHDYEKDTIAHAVSNAGSHKTKASKSDVSKPAHVKMDAHKSTKPHTKTIQETADEMKPIGFKTSREIASPDTSEINAQEVEIAQPKQSPDTVDTVVSEVNEVSPSTQVSPGAPPASAPEAAVPTSDAETPQDKPATSITDTAKNQTATPTESGGGFNPFGPIRTVIQPFINVATAVRDQIRPVIGAALSPVLGPLSPGKGGAAQNESSTTITQPSEGNATSPASPTSDEEPQKETQTVVPAETASVTTVQDSVAPEVRTHETGAATDAKTATLPAQEASRNGSQTPLSPFPVPFDPVAAINRFTKPAVDAATNVRDQVRPIFDAAVAPIVDALNPTKEATDSSTTAGSAEPQLRASDDMPESAAEEPAEPNKRRYSNYKLFSVYIGNDTAALDVISALRENLEVDFWSEPALNRNVSILIPPGLVQKVQNIFKDAGIEYHILTDDIQRWIDREDEENRPGVFLEQRDITHYAFDKYHRVEEITGLLDILGQKYSHIATVRNIGMTQEGRPIKGVILSTGSNRPVLWFDGGIHAREWVSPASLLYFLHKMTAGYGSDSTITTLLQTFDFYIFPVVNPDGYAYTFTSDRLWRKNRSGGRRGCRGVDPNRNFAAAFGGAGTSGHPCSDIFRGAQAFSEAESRAIRDAVLELGSRIKGYVTVHSYSQLIMVPYGHGRGSYTRDYADQISAARAVSRAIQIRSGVYYQVGTISGLLGSAAGSSSDWVYDGAKIKYSIAVELRDKGRYGFLLPNFLIVPTADEASEGFKAFAKFVARRELNKSIH